MIEWDKIMKQLLAFMFILFVFIKPGSCLAETNTENDVALIMVEANLGSYDKYEDSIHIVIPAEQFEEILRSDSQAGRSEKVTFFDYLDKIIPLLNVLIIIGFSIKSISDSKRRDKIARIGYWYSQIILPHQLDTMDQSEDDFEKLITENFLKNRGMIEKEVILEERSDSVRQNTNTLFLKFQRVIEGVRKSIERMSFFDEKLSVELLEIVEEFEDDFMEMVSEFNFKIYNDPNKIARNDIITHKENLEDIGKDFYLKFKQTLYGYDINLLEYDNVY